MASYDQSSYASPEGQTYNHQYNHQYQDQEQEPSYLSQTQSPQTPQYNQYRNVQQQQSPDYFPPTSANSNEQNSYTHQREPTSPPSASKNNHERQRSRGFSLSSKNSGSQKDQLVETSAEKNARRLHSKADPTLAMNEAEPSAIAAMQPVSMPSLRSIQHKDVLGNLIVDPDLSNPTRSRWERPLDTIRAFEAAIDGNYSHRQNFTPASKESWTKRGSIYSNTPRDAYRASYYGSPNNYSDPPMNRPRNQPNSFQTSGSGDDGLDGTPANYSTAPSMAAATPASRPTAVAPPEEKRKSWFKKKFRK